MKKNLCTKFVIVIITCILSTHAFAANTCLEDEEKCWECGLNCTARLDQSGKMTISGTGPMYDYVFNWRDRPWVQYLQEITSLDVQRGITTVGWNAFYDTAIATATLADSVENIKCGGIGKTNLTDLIIGENSQLNQTKDTTGNPGIYGINHLIISCKGDIEKCQTKQNLFTDIGISTDFRFYEEKDSNGKITLKYEKGGYKTYDSHGNITGKYDIEGNILATYNYNPDGSVLTYDSNGKLIGIQGKRILTVDEATALVKNNKNTFSIRYR